MSGSAAAATIGSVASSFSVSAPSNVNGSYHGVSGTAQNISTSVALATPSGGTAPFTYAWTQVGTSAYTWTISSAATASTAFTANSVGKGEEAEADFKVTVTDAAGIVRTAQVHAHVLNVSTA